jgi:septal ring factor EnvC (AmiA/AmiB activator)
MFLAQITKILSVKRILLFSLAFLIFSATTLQSQSARAETIKELQAKSQQLQAQIDSNNSQIQELSKQAESLQVKISELSIEISSAQTQIDLTQVKLEELGQRLIETEAELERQKSLLKAALRALYERRGASTVELLVASDSFSDFINEQEYLERLQTAVKDSADKVVDLKIQIEKEKLEQEALLKQQQEQRTLLDARRQEQQTILDQTQGQEAKYREIVASQQAELEKAEEQLAALLSAGNFVSLGPISRGQVVGRVGSTGYSTGPHIHFQTYRNGSAVNPYAGGGSLINGYLWPLAGGVGYISQDFGCVADYWAYATKCNDGQNSFHTGLDIAASAYTTIVAADDGDIIFKGCRSGLGYVVVIDHGGGWQTWYPHQVTPDGQVYGYCG